MQAPVIKELIKLADSLRSQLAKNSILTVTTILENLPTRDLDPVVETILPGILKKAADTMLPVISGYSACSSKVVTSN